MDDSPFAPPSDPSPDPTPLAEDRPLPAALVGCLVCHQEGGVTLGEVRKLPLLPSYPPLSCAHCGARALLDWDGQHETRWRIRYRHLPPAPPYLYAGRRLAKAGWLDSDEALDTSTEIYVQRQRLQQSENGDLAWLKPSRLSPPPPLMRPDETVYLTLKPAVYGEASPPPKVKLPFGLGQPQMRVLDSGTCYITDSKIHLLGQQRDRSNRLSEISHLDYQGGEWFIQVTVGDQPYQYQGMNLSATVDAEVIIAIIRRLASQGA